MSTILVVDDEPTLLAVVAEVLREEGYTVIEAGSGHAALAVLAQTRPALVILDVMMPGMDGPATRGQMRAHPNGAGVPIVFASALADPAHLPADADGFLRKPFALDQLVALVTAHVGPPTDRS